MKIKKLMLLLALSAMIAMPVTAEGNDRTMSISASPLSLILGSADLLYQLKITNYMSLTAPVMFSYYWPLSTVIGLANKNNKNTTVTTTKAPIAFSGGVGARFSPASQIMNDSFYLEPRIKLGYAQFEAEFKDFGKISLSTIKLTPMLMLGWDWYWESGFLASLGGGLGYAFNLKNQFDVSPQLTEAIKFAGGALPNFSANGAGNFAWDLEFKLGYAW